MKKLNQIEIIKSFENIYSWLILMVIFAVYYLGYVPNSNEENYLQLAKEFTDPNWIKDSFILQESAGTRLLYQYIVGFFLKFLSFEVVVFIFRSFLIIAFSFILDRIYKSLKVNNIMIVVHLVLIYLDKQSYLGGSWIFLSAEAKSFAYLFVFLALYYILEKKYNLTVFFLVIATYFHVLIGGYAFIYFGLSILILEKFNFRTNYKLILKLFIYVVAVAPFVLFLLMQTHFSTDLKPNADWIYTYFRNPHHTTLSDGNYIGNFKGVFLSFIAILSLLYFRKQENNNQKLNVLYVIGIATLVGTLVLLPLIFFDKNGTILKFYIFRINAFSTFIFTLVLTKWIFKILKTEYNTIIYSAVGIVTSIYLISSVALSNVKLHKDYNSDPIVEVADYIKSNTTKDAVVLGLFDIGNEKYSLTRQMERDRFVVHKFVPADLSKIHEWYYRVLAKEDILKDINHLKFATNQYKIDFILSDIKLEKDFLELTYTNETYFLYKNLLQKK